MLYRYTSHWTFSWLCLLGLISSGVNLVIAMLVGTLTNLATNRSFDQLPATLLLAAGGLIITYGALVAFNFVKTAVVRHLNQTLRAQAFQGMLSQPGGLDDGALGFLTNDFKLLETNRFNAEVEIITSFETLVLALGYALYLNWLITVIFLIGSAVPSLISNAFQKPLQRASTAWSTQNQRYVDQTKNFLAGADTLALYNGQPAATRKNRQTITGLEAALAKMNLLNLNASAVINVVANISTFILPFLIGITLVIRGHITLGALFAIVQLANSFVNPILNMLAQRNNLATTKPIVTRLTGYLHAAEQPVALPAPAVTSLTLTDIRLERQHHELVRGLDLTIRPGQKIAVIGRSGIGKSTLLAFLRSGQFGQAQTVVLNQTPTTVDHLRGLFAYASQEAVIFADSLRFNLTLGASVTDDQLRQVCHQLDLDDLVTTQGLDYQLGTNADQLSGGQLERIELGRALLANRPILLLDEITDSLDRQTAADVHRYLWQSPLTLIEVVHHYDEADLAHYDRVIDFDTLVAPHPA